jgi:hypothetical protein
MRFRVPSPGRENRNVAMTDDAARARGIVERWLGHHEDGRLDGLINDVAAAIPVDDESYVRNCSFDTRDDATLFDFRRTGCIVKLDGYWIIATEKYDAALLAAEARGRAAGRLDGIEEAAQKIEADGKRLASVRGGPVPGAQLIADDLRALAEEDTPR